MKLLLTTTIAFCLLALTCSAQWTAGSGVITTTNNVGIGTASPLSPLSISDAAGDVTLALNTTGGLIGDSQYLSVNVRSLFGYDGGRQAIYIGDKGPYGVAANKPIIFDTNGAERIRVTATGNVGIGTTTPDQKLSVNGTVHSKAVVVDNSIFPDYVFSNTYALRPLSALKTYIDQNHHLPEIPSAAEVVKNGQNLGEMNMLLLKKVEELTLYMIELNKTVKAQQQEIEQLKKAGNKAL